ncbi:hypothetical protein [Streptomyces sp. NPDC127112]
MTEMPIALQAVIVAGVLLGIALVILVLSLYDRHRRNSGGQ